MSPGWKQALLPGAEEGSLPGGYRREGEIVGRDEFLDTSDPQLWSKSEFVARARTPHTTSAVEARIRRRHLERMVEEHGIDRGQPVLDLGCADGTFAHDLLALGFSKLVSTDILPTGVATLDRSLSAEMRDRVLLLVDDMMRLPFRGSSFGLVVAWGILSVSGDFERALELAWGWVAPGGHMLLAEPLLEQALVYALVRGDLDEFHRIRTERTRAAMWDEREDRYGVNPIGHYAERLRRLPQATVAEAGGVSILPSLTLGGLAQNSPLEEEERAALAETLGDPALDELALWRQAFWLLRKEAG